MPPKLPAAPFVLAVVVAIVVVSSIVELRAVVIAAAPVFGVAVELAAPLDTPVLVDPVTVGGYNVQGDFSVPSPQAVGVDRWRGGTIVCQTGSPVPVEEGQCVCPGGITKTSILCRDWERDKRRYRGLAGGLDGLP